MHKIILTAILLIISLNCFSQNVEISNTRLKYNEDFSPYLELKFANRESRTITTVLFGVSYRNRYNDNSTMKNVIVHTNIAPYQTKTLTFSVPDYSKNNYKPYEVMILRVRYNDGTTEGCLNDLEKMTEESIKRNKSLMMK